MLIGEWIRSSTTGSNCMTQSAAAGTYRSLLRLEGCLYSQRSPEEHVAVHYLDELYVLLVGLHGQFTQLSAQSNQQKAPPTKTRPANSIRRSHDGAGPHRAVTGCEEEAGWHRNKLPACPAAQHSCAAGRAKHGRRPKSRCRDLPASQDAVAAAAGRIALRPRQAATAPWLQRYQADAAAAGGAPSCPHAAKMLLLSASRVQSPARRAAPAGGQRARRSLRSARTPLGVLTRAHKAAR